MLVNDDCSVPGHEEVFVVGDLASMKQENGQPVPGVAQGAIQMGQHVAKQIRRDLRGEPREKFRYRDKGDLATIGRAAAVARLGRLKLSGFSAWLIWVLVHIMYLIGFRNRILVMLQWGWAYNTNHRVIRLITGDQQVEIRRARSPDDQFLETPRTRSMLRR